MFTIKTDSNKQIHFNELFTDLKDLSHSNLDLYTVIEFIRTLYYCLKVLSVKKRELEKQKKIQYSQEIVEYIEFWQKEGLNFDEIAEQWNNDEITMFKDGKHLKRVYNKIKKDSLCLVKK